MARPAPILLAVYRLDVGGNERDLSKLARHLDPARYQAHVVSYHPEGERRAELDRAGIPILRLPVRSLHDHTAVAGAARLWKYLRRHKIELVQAFDAPTSIYLVPLARLFGVRAVVSCHLYFRQLIPPPEYHALRLVDRLAHRIVVNANAIKKHLIQDYGLPPERIFVSHNGVETDVFFPSAGPRPPCLEGASVVIGSLCVMREEKRIDTLLRAFARIRPRDPRMRLLIVGDGPMWDQLIALRRHDIYRTSDTFR